MSSALNAYERWKDAFGVSRETFERIETYGRLLLQWSKKINLISHADQTHLWERHLWDSAHLYQTMQQNVSRETFEKGRLLDIGSGGGLPGCILAILGKKYVTLVESDERKTAFLHRVNGELSLAMAIHTQRIENVSRETFDLITARALAPVSQLLGYSEPFMGTDSVCFFPKGRQWRKEIDEAKQRWHFTVRAHPGHSDPEAAILTLSELQAHDANS